MRPSHLPVVFNKPAFSGRVAAPINTSSWANPRCRHRADRRMHVLLSALEQKAGVFPRAGPSEPPPAYESIDSQPVNRAIMSLFRRKMVAAIGRDSENQGYDILAFVCLLSSNAFLWCYFSTGRSELLSCLQV